MQNWGLEEGWGEFQGPIKPKYFQRNGSGTGMAVGFFGGPGHQLEFKSESGKNGFVFGPPYTISFWIRRDSEDGACVDVFSSVRTDSQGKETYWDYINIFIWGHRDTEKSDGHDPKAGHIVVQHQGFEYYRMHVGQISTDPLPVGEWKYVVVHAMNPEPWETYSKVALST